MIETTHADLLHELHAIRDEFSALKHEVAQMREVVDAWQAVKTGGKIVGWVAKLGTAVLALVVAIRSLGGHG